MNPQMHWAFAIVNNRLAEIYYTIKRDETKILGHCYVKKTEYKTKREQLYIQQDTEKFWLIWRQNRYIVL